MSYAEAIVELYQAPLATFVAERKRLAGNLKAEGDKPGAAKLAKLGRPTMSAWVVNQLYWHARDAFDAMLATAERLRTGDLGATAAHRESLTRLRTRASTILTDAGHAPTEATLRRVTTTLSALAAVGGFEPDLPGTLAEDRDPPGFDAIGLVVPENPKDRRVIDNGDLPGIVFVEGDSGPLHPDLIAHNQKHHGTTRPELASVPVAPELAPKSAQTEDADDDEDAVEDGANATDDADLAEQRRTAAALDREAMRAAEAARLKRVEEAERRQIEAQAAAERRRADEEQARRLADRQRIEAALRTAQGEIVSRGRTVEQLRGQLTLAEKAVADSRAAVADLERKLAELDR